MSDLTLTPVRARRRSRRRALPALVALVLLLALPAAALGTRALLHRGEVLPGATVLGGSLSGLGAEEAGLRIRSLTAQRLAQPVPLAAGDDGAQIAAAKLFTLDRQATTEAALRVGRESWTARLRSLLHPLTGPREVAPVLVERPAAQGRLSALLGRFATAPRNAAVELEGVTPVVRPAEPGSVAAVGPLLAAIETRVVAGGDAVPVAFEPAAPAIDDEAAAVAAEEARIVLAAPVALTFDGQPVGRLSREELAGLLRFTEAERRLLVMLDREALGKRLAPLLAPFGRKPVDASFRVDGDRAYVVPAEPGTAVDPQAALVAVTTAAHQRGERTAALRLKAVPAQLTTAKAQALGITERVSSFTTEMGVSSANRIHNVQLMADTIDGTIVLPGDTFSFNERVGPRTEERGFREGSMIVGSLLLPSIGGGVCQTATTLFNNAFELGLPVTARVNHSFYISHYPMGRDAAVSWGGPDFGFRNDLESALLIKASYTNDTLTFTFYGTSQGRTVEARTGPQTNWREPKLTYALDPTAPRGSRRVVTGTRQRGFDVTVFRTVKEDGKVIREDSFTSHYVSVGDTAIYGPGSTIPGEYFVIPST
jgi:vancomycin resistance protein YoaR